MAEWAVTAVGMAPVQHRFLLNGRDIVGRTMRTVLAKRLPEAVTYARANYLTGGTTRTRLAEHTGRLKRSFDAEILGTQFVTGHLGYIKAPPAWVGVHEYGATIRPKQAKYLTVPLADAARGRRAREFPNTFARKSRQGNLIIFQKTAGGGITPLYLLKTSVVIKARPALAPTVARFVPIITQDLQETLDRLMRGG